MTTPSRLVHRLVTLTVLAAATALPGLASAQRLECTTLLEQIEDKLQAKHVQNYRLELVDSAEVTDAKVVGSCNGGTKKVVYTRTVPVQTVQSAASAQ